MDQALSMFFLRCSYISQRDFLVFDILSKNLKGTQTAMIILLFSPTLRQNYSLFCNCISLNFFTTTLVTVLFTDFYFLHIHCNICHLVSFTYSRRNSCGNPIHCIFICNKIHCKKSILSCIVNDFCDFFRTVLYP